MALRQKLWYHIREDFHGYFMHSRCYSSKLDWDKLRPMIHKRIQSRAKDYPVKGMVPVAYDVIAARTLLYSGISTLLKYFPVKACKFCPEVFIGEEGHWIQTCHGYRCHAKNQVHDWIDGSLNDILVSVETFHLHDKFHDIIKHDERFDFDRIPAVLELCWQAGANIYTENLHSGSDTIDCGVDAESDLSHHLMSVANRTLEAWDRMRSGVQRLLLVYPARVCNYCSEVHVGSSGHKVRLCGVFKHESWRGNHFWKKAEVDDLVPPKVVWRRRTQDPPVLVDNGRGYYGHAPAVVELCVQAGAIVPIKYHTMMKVHGQGPPTGSCFSDSRFSPDQFR